MEIGNRIKLRREELGMSQEELATKVGYKSRSSINKIEIDGRGLPQKKIALFAKVLKTTPAYLMGWEAMSDEEIGNVFFDNTRENIITNMRSFFSKSDVSHFESYIKLNPTNKKMANNYTNKLLNIQALDEELEVNAAHERTDIEVTVEMKKHDDDIMDSEDF